MFADNSIEKIDEKQALFDAQGDFNLKIPYALLPIVYQSIPIAMFSHIKYTFAWSGNRCGHDPDNPHVITYHNSNRRPKILQWATDRVRKFRDGDTRYLKELKEPNTKTKSGDKRFNRSEGRESIANVSEIILHNLELESMTVCKDDIVYNRPTLGELTENGTLISLSRAKRALNKMVKAGYLTVTRQYEKTKNLFKGLACVRKINKEFFEALNLGKHYHQSQDIKRKSSEKKKYKKSKKQLMAQRFDACLPRRDIIFKKIDRGVNTIEVIDHTAIEAMRKELKFFYVEHFPDANKKQVDRLIFKYTTKQLMGHLEKYRSLKSPDPPS